MPRNREKNKAQIFALLTAALFLVPVCSQAQISGVVVDSSTAQGLAGALVTRQGEGTQVTTAPDGSFTIAVSGTNLVLVAAKKGYFSGSVTITSPATGAQISIDPVPSWDNSAYAIANPATCGVCHPKQLDQWLDTPMADGGINSWVHDIYAGNGSVGGMGGFVYTRDSVFAATNPESECASCHQPQHWIENPSAALDPAVGGSNPGVIHGISCDICHKIADVDTSKINHPGIFPGAVVYNRPDPGEQVVFGLLADADFTAPGLMRPSYQPQLAAEVCATCHQDANDPDEDHSYSGVISEPTYLEWAASPYSDPASASYASCVDCHMPPAETNEVCINIATPDRDPDRVRSHRIAGTTPEYLENAVDLAITANQASGNLVVSATIANTSTGHHVPTGVTVRNMILLVEAWEDGNDPLTDPLEHTGPQHVHELGGVGDPALGYFAGMPGKFFAKVNHDASGNGPTFFTDATGIQFDNRLPALASDTSSYSFRLPTTDATIHVRARLIYRRAFRFLVDAKGWTQDGHGQALEDVQAPYYGHLMESSVMVVNTSGSSESAEIPTLPFPARILLLLLMAAAGWMLLRK